MKRLLLDTQVLLWWLADDRRLPPWAIAAVQAPGAEVFVSQVSLWELAVKQREGRVQVNLARLEQEVNRQHFQWLPLDNNHLLALAQQDNSALPSDRFDQLLLVQSRLEPLLLLTADPTLYPWGDTVLPLDPPEPGQP